MNKPLFLFVGKSASGKTTIANMLEHDGYKQISSYTTRPPRYECEKGHTFISEEEYDKLENIMASTLYNGYRYCTTLDQVKEADIYVVDVEGVRTLLKNYNIINREIFLFYFDTTIVNRMRRMLGRGDHCTKVIERILNDMDNWEEQIINIDGFLKLNFYSIDANQDLDTVYTNIKDLIKITTQN